MALHILKVGSLSLAAMLCVAAAPTPHVITRPDWLEKPSGQDIARYYPTLASTLDIEGRAVLDCKVDIRGAVGPCEVTTVAPEGLGFDRAALALAGRFRMKPQTLDGEPVEGGVIRLPLTFRLPKPIPVETPPRAPNPDPERLALARQIGSTDLLAGKQAHFEATRLNRLRQSSLTASPAAVEAAMGALRLADDAIRPRYKDVSEQGYAIALTARDLRSWLSYLSSPTASAVERHREELERAMLPTAADDARRVAATAKAMFCRTRDCGPQLDQAALLRLAAQPKAIIESPEWSETPDAGAFVNAYPIIGKSLRMDGWAMLRCQTTDVGRLKACLVVAEKPDGLGFAAAALSLSSRYRLAGQPAGPGAGDTVDVPMTFTTKGMFNTSSPPATAATPPSMGALAAAREIITVLDILGPIDHWAADLDGALATEAAPGVDPATRRDALQSRKSAEAAERSSTLDAYAGLYAGVFTEGELKAYLAYLRSPAGQLVIGHNPVFNARLSAAMPAITAEARQIARQRFCETEACAPPPKP